MLSAKKQGDVLTIRVAMSVSSVGSGWGSVLLAGLAGFQFAHLYRGDASY